MKGDKLDFNEKNAVDLKNYRNSCIYFLIDGNKVVYIGKSKHPRQRIPCHRYDKKFEKIKIIKCLEKELFKLEDFYMMKYQPKYNVLKSPERKKCFRFI